MQKASCGVRMLTACQLRLSTSTIALFSMSFIKLQCNYGACAPGCLFFVGACARWKIGCLAWFCSKSSGFRDRRAPDYATRQWSAEP